MMDWLAPPYQLLTLLLVLTLLLGLTLLKYMPSYISLYGFNAIFVKWASGALC